MALGTIIGGASAISGNLGGAFDTVKDTISGVFGNNRGSKRDKRNKFRDAVHKAGVNSTFMADTHSDDWQEVKKVASFIQQNGQPAVNYINNKYGYRRKFGNSKGGVTAQQVISGFQGAQSSVSSGSSNGLNSGTGSNNGSRQSQTMLIIIGLATMLGFGYMFTQ